MEFHENFLQLIWKYQYFDKTQSQTTDNKILIVKKIGYQNFHEGPDFLESQIHIQDVDYHGHVEIHRKSSDWTNHNHQLDPRYNSVILHVVWVDDKPIKRNDGTSIPTLELKGKVLLDVVRNYERLISSQDEIICGGQMGDIQPILKFSMLEKSLVERLEEKSQMLYKILAQTNTDWQETTYSWLFKCFGFKTNAESMLLLAESIPYLLLQRQGMQSLTIQAILFGQAGLIPDDPIDEFGAFLKKEYEFFKTKYGLKPALKSQQWKMKGVRPGNFPSIRIAQIAEILAKNPNLLSAVLHDTSDFKEFKKLFGITTPDYWQHHYQIGKSSGRILPKQISAQAFSLLVVNFIVPIWYAYGKYMQDNTWQEKCFDILQDALMEDNFIIRKYIHYDWQPQNAFDTQGMIGLYQQYCKPKRCLDCKIGQNLLKPLKNDFA